MMKYFLNTREGDKGKVVAACDRELIGKEFREGKVTLTIDEDFYRGREAEFVHILDEMKDAATTNFVGEKIIGKLIDADLVEEDEVNRVDGIPHVHIYFI